MGVNRLNAVQKATYFLQKSKVGKNEECTVTVKTDKRLKFYDDKADDKRLKFYDQLQLFAEVALLIRCEKIYCIFAKVQSFLLHVSE